MKYTDSRSRLMKRNSRSLIIYCVGKLVNASRAQIEEYTGLSHAHVCGVVDELISEKELIEVESVSTGPGRPTTYLQINPNCTYAAGVWLAEDSIEIGIAGATGEILIKDSLPYSGNPLADIDAVVESIENCAERVRKPMESIKGVGVVVAGLVDPKQGAIRTTMHETGFVDVPVAKILHEKTDLSIFVDTDIRAAALADQWYKGEHDRVLYISFCDGIGAAFINGRELFGVAHGEAPGIAHIIIDPNGPVCECGKHGCLQVYTSNNAFIRALWPEADLQHLSAHERVNLIEKGADLAARGDLNATNAVSEIARYMGLGIANSINMLDPQVVYIVGTLVDHLPEMVIPMIRAHAAPHITQTFREVQIRPLPEINEFELKGAFGLVLFSQLRTVNQDINSVLLTLNA